MKGTLVMKPIHFHLLKIVAATIVMALLLLVPGLMPVASAAPVLTHQPAAPTCAGTGCNDLDPYTTGCAGSGASYWVVDAVPVSWQGVSYGWLQLWYSGTCGTNWARYVCSASCRSVSLALMVCGSGGEYSIQGPINVLSTGQTGQEYLPATPAWADAMFQLYDRVYSEARTGCY